MRRMLLSRSSFTLVLVTISSLLNTVYCTNPSLITKELPVIINKGSIDENTYEYKILPNGLKVLFVTNGKLDKSACSITVKTGSIDDTIPGIAHFLEHMLFMGNEKYSRENEWDDFLNSHHGSSNATTDNAITTYFFDISPDYFVDALDRFCEFFVSPLFDADAIETVIEAIDSEYKNGLSRDNNRLFRLVNVMSTEKYNKFACGNKDTLLIPDIREVVTTFWWNNYSSDKMCLVVYHSKDVKMEVTEKFSGIPTINKNDKTIHNTSTTFEKQLFDDKNLNRLIYMNAISDIKYLSIIIEVPKHKTMFKDNTYGYLSLLLNGKGKKSLNYMLSEQGYAFNTNASIENYMDYSSLFIGVGLTDLGYKECEKVINTIKMYLKNIPGNKAHYKDFKQYMRRKFKYMEQEKPINHVYTLSNDMQYYPIENVLDHEFICRKYNEKEMKMVLDILRDSLNWLVIVTGKIDNFETSLKEEFYGIEYKVSLQILEDLPKSMTVALNDGKMFFLAEDKYKIPESYVTIRLHANITLENYLNYLIYISMCEHKYNELHSEFLFFNRVSIQTRIVPEGLEFLFSGFDENLCKAIKLFFKVFVALKNESYNQTKESIRQTLSMELNDRPYRLLTKRFTGLIYNNIPDTAVLIDQIGKLEYTDIKIHHSYYVDMFVCGSGDVYSFRSLFLQIKSKIGGGRKNIVPVSVPRNTKLSFTTQDPVNNACGVYIYGGKVGDVNSIAMLSLVIQIGKEMFNNQLRTKEAFGYVVQNLGIGVYDDKYGVYIVQSEKENDEIEKRIHLFIAELQTLIDKMDDREFKIYQESVISDYQEDFKNLSEFNSFYRYLYFSDSFDMDYKQKIIEAVRNVDKNEILISSFYSAVVYADKK